MSEIKVGDRVRLLTTDVVDRSYGLCIGDVFKVLDVGVGSIVDVITSSDTHRPLLKSQIEKVEGAENMQKEMTFPEMAQKLIDGEFEVGTELVSREASFWVDKSSFYGYGLKHKKNNSNIEIIASSGHLNSRWKVKEQKIKEMSIEQLQKELGYKIKIV